MNNNRFVLGVLGLGEGRSIISAALSSPYYDLGTICDLNEDLCRARCTEFDLKNYTTQYEDMLADPSIDVIGIYTPDQFHALHIKMALQAGKHVICTKPVLLDLKDARELLEIQKKADLHVFIGQSSRFFESLKNQHETYANGRLGELVSVETHYKSDSRWFLDRPWSKTKGFSWMYNFMIHAVDLAAWYLPDIEEVFGYGTVSPNTKEFGLDVEDTLTFLAKDRSGRFATIGGAYGTPALNKKIEFPIECTLRATNGISRGGYNQLILHEKMLREDLPTDKKCYALDAHESDFYEETTHSYEDRHPYYFRFEGETHHAGEYQNYIDYFAIMLQKGETPLPDLREGIHTIGIMEAMHASLRTGQPVKVSEILAQYL
ncbi:MAG: Gfo/Idh/MocA family protein [Lachnospiraceae bacterium]